MLDDCFNSGRPRPGNEHYGNGLDGDGFGNGFSDGALYGNGGGNGKGASVFGYHDGDGDGFGVAKLIFMTAMPPGADPALANSLRLAAEEAVLFGGCDVR